MATFKELYDEYLDELCRTPNPPGFNYSDLLKSHSPVTYNAGFNDFLDDASRFRCGECGTELTSDEVRGADLDDETICGKCKGGRL